MKPENLFRLHQNLHLEDPQTLIDFRLNANGELEDDVPSMVPPMATAQTEFAGYYPMW